jgi:hypothetical protein
MMASGVHGRRDFLVAASPFSLGRLIPPRNFVSCQGFWREPEDEICRGKDQSTAYLIVDVANVMVQVVSVSVAETLDVLLDWDRVS